MREPSGKGLYLIPRYEGVTDSEKYLSQLCNHSFLSLWSYSGIYRDQGRGKEVCDLVVVFEEHIIIFSDKHCKFPNSGDLKVDWGRWFRRAVLNSAEQVWGAERWIRQFPNRLFIDPSCRHQFPISLPDPATASFLALAQPDDMPEEKYRRIRGNLLSAYCRVVKLEFPEALDIIGIATEPGNVTERSEDLGYYDAREWTDDEKAEAERLTSAIRTSPGAMKNWINCARR